MAKKKYILRETSTYRATFIDHKHAINVVRCTPKTEKCATFENVLKWFELTESELTRIINAISIIPQLSPDNGYYYFDDLQIKDIRKVINKFTCSGVTLSRDISRSIRNGFFIEVDKLPSDEDDTEETAGSENGSCNGELNKDQSEKYNKKYVDSTRRKNKKLIKKKFIIGKKYFLKVKSVTDFEHIYKIYELKKFIYSINNRSVNVVIMKRINGEDGEISTTFTLNRNDCAKYHIKYEKGLEVFPMQLNWCIVNEDNVKFKKALNEQ